MRVWILALAVLLLGMASGIAYAQVGPVEETIVYNINPVDGTIGQVTNMARAWRGDGDAWFCNMDHKVIFNVDASMAQWISAQVSATNILWRILKPGDYAMDTIQIAVRSNGDVNLHVQAIQPLTNAEGDVIPTKWALTPKVFDPTGVWTAVNPRPDQWFDEQTAPPSTILPNPYATAPGGPTIPEDQVHNPIHLALWNRVTPHASDSACEYSGFLHLDFLLAEQKPWVDPGTGEFSTSYPPPPYPPAPVTGG